MANPGSSIRSAARATSSAYKRLPIRWRLAGGSAALTLVILLGFATIVGVLTTRRIQSDFNQQVEEAADQLAKQTDIRVVAGKNGSPQLRYRGPNLEAYAAAQSAVVRVVTEDNEVIKSSPDAPYLVPAARRPRSSSRGYRVESRPIKVEPVGGGRVRPVRAPALRRPGDRQPGALLPRPRRPRRHRARAARRHRDRAARDERRSPS